MWKASVYDGSQHPARRPYDVEMCPSESEARRAAARMLGHSSLRGASSWAHPDGGRVYQFGPRIEDTEYDFVRVQEVEL